MPASEECLVAFEVECLATRPGDTVRVVGSLPILGSWAPERSHVLFGVAKEGFPRWRSEWLSMPSGSEPCEYKYVVCDDKGEFRWEGVPNRRLSLPAEVPADKRLEMRDRFDSTEGLPTAQDVTESIATTAQGVYDDSECEKIPPIPSWDSGFSTVATIGEFASCDQESMVLNSVISWSRRGSLSSEVSKEESEEDRGVQDLLRGGGFKDAFEKGRMIGDGAFGVVHKCTARASGREFVVKEIETEGFHPLDQAAVQTEIRLHKALPSHDHIVKLHGSFEEQGVMKLVMDMCSGGDLYILLDDLKQRHRWKGGDYALSERAAANMTRQLLSAISFCHERGIVHRDIKPGNILMAEPVKQVPLESAAAVIKLCDFGYATECRPQDPPALLEFVGSPDYLAPEVARRESYGCAVDVWAAGVVLFECLRGRVPFDADTDKEIVRLVRKAEVSYDAGWSRISEQATACVRSLLVEQVPHRPTADEALVHPWLMSQPASTVTRP